MPKCLGAELSGHFGTVAEVSSGHFGTSAEVSWYRSVLGPKCPVTTLTLTLLTPVVLNNADVSDNANEGIW